MLPEDEGESFDLVGSEGRGVYGLFDADGERERVVMALGVSDHVGFGRTVVAESGVGERVQRLLRQVDAFHAGV